MKILPLTLAFFLTTLMLFGVDWPVRNREIVTTFGSNRGGQFTIGLTISGRNTGVYAVEEGEVIFSLESSDAKRGLPSGMGNFLVIQHDDGLKSIYTHLQSGSIRDHADDGFRVGEGTVIGEVGDSGWAYGKQLGFAVMDSEFNQFVNPLLLLPSIIDSVKPVVGNMRFQQGDVEIPLEEAVSIKAGEYHLLADIYDISEYTNGMNPMAPFSVTLYINGSETGRYTFEALQEQEGKIILQKSEGKTFSQIYAGAKTIDLGEYDVIPGNMSIEIIVTDYAGNEADIIRDIVITTGQDK